MSDARTVIETVCEVWFDEFNRAKGGPMRPLPPMILAALAEAGLVIVPRVPTPDLCFKILAALPSDWEGFQAEDIKELWRAMVEAANER